ncbi:MAG TPA: VWA domain-containing protein [Gaiella sp.]|nr:VWA domain-containing protein [Gaiella sp.]
MSFQSPMWLLGLLAIPLLVLVYLVVGRRHKRAADRFANPALVPNLVPSGPGWRRYVPFAIALGALALLVVGIARPHVVRDVTRDEATIVLAIDTSRSMAANDVKPSRFEAANAAATTFLDTVPDAYRVGIVSFSTGASTVLTPTTDRDAAKVALGELRLGSGTAIGNAIVRSVELASTNEGRQTQSGEKSPAAVLLLSDGAQTAGGVTPDDAVKEARKLGIPVSTVALGTGDAVVQVPLPGGLQQRVTVAPDTEALQQIAKATGGTFAEAPSAAKLQEVYRDLGTRLAKDPKRVEVTSAFAAGGAILLVLGGALSTWWFRRAL